MALKANTNKADLKALEEQLKVPHTDFVQVHSYLANIQILGKRLASGVEEPSQPVKEKPKNHFNTLGLDLDLK